jgi:hypothetical protein
MVFIIKPVLLLTLIVAGISGDLCDCPKKPFENVRSINFCGNQIDKNCQQETIYICDYSKTGDSGKIKIQEDCKKKGFYCTTGESCNDYHKSFKKIGVCKNHGCAPKPHNE